MPDGTIFMRNCDAGFQNGEAQLNHRWSLSEWSITALDGPAVDADFLVASREGDVTIVFSEGS